VQEKIDHKIVEQEKLQAYLEKRAKIEVQQALRKKAEAKIKVDKVAKREQVRIQRLKEAEAHKQIQGFNLKLELFLMAHKVYDYPLDRNLIDDIRQIVKKTKLAREKNTLTEKHLQENDQYLYELEIEEQKINLQLQSHLAEVE